MTTNERISNAGPKSSTIKKKGSEITAAPYYGRLYKMSLDSGKAPTAVTNTAVLNSYAGTGVTGSGTSVLVTYGTSSSDATKIGGLQSFTKANLTSGTLQQRYDARSVVVDPSDVSKAYVIAGPTVGAPTSSAVYTYNSAANAAPASTYTVGGNTTAESKSSVVAGNTLMLASTGSGGFKVLCKATGATLATVAAPTFTGIPASKSVVNSVAAVPGYLFSANGEAGVNVYTLKKTATTVLGISTPAYLGTNYCQGIVVTYLGRFALDSDNNDATYVNAELSANSIKPVTVLNVLNIVTSRLLAVASGNKGISLINVGALDVLSAFDVNDF